MDKAPREIMSIGFARGREASVVVTNGSWRHIRCTRVYHRDHPEICGQGGSVADATAHLLNQLARALDSAPSRALRAAFEGAIAEVRAARPLAAAR